MSNHTTTNSTWLPTLGFTRNLIAMTNYIDIPQYQPPRIDIIVLEGEGILCGSFDTPGPGDMPEYEI